MKSRKSAVTMKVNTLEMNYTKLYPLMALLLNALLYTHYNKIVLQNTIFIPCGTLLTASPPDIGSQTTLA